MCGIIGYWGYKNAVDILVNGLHRLEYRGYDSSGTVIMDRGKVHARHTVGRVEELGRELAARPVDGSVGIAHTRWATHGQPSIMNAHPHMDMAGKIFLVHNGIIENHASIRTFLEEQEIEFTSETDTESLAQLIGYFYAQGESFVNSIRRALSEVNGTYGIAVMCTDEPQSIIAARCGSPLIVGVGENEYFIASDGSAIIEHTDRVIYLNDHEMVCLNSEGIELSTLDAHPVQAKLDVLEMNLEQIQLSGYEHHMLKEINEQPESLRTCLRGRLDHREKRIHLGGLSEFVRDTANCRRLLLTGCGTAWHAALVGEYLFEELARVNTEVEYASELRYRNPIIEEGTLAVVISQSGETADTLAALRELKTKGATVLGVVNAVGSTIARETDAGVYLHVGPEIGVASTKAFTAQVAVLAMIATDLGRRRHLSPERTAEMLDELALIPDKVEKVLALDNQIKQLAARLVDRDNWLYLGRGVNYPVALEGALKLKEISYIHAEGLPAAEMKHGPIALIDSDMPVVVIAPQDHTYDKLLSNIEEVRSRKGRIIAVANEGDTRLEALAEAVLYVPSTLAILSPLITTIPLQLLAYHAAILRGLDVDRPRNLAKSVTVE